MRVVERGAVRIELEVLADAEAVAVRGAGVVMEAARAAMDARGRVTLAVSGGRTPWRMFEILAGADLPWADVGVWQVDERIAPDGDPDRNLTGLVAVLPNAAALHPMPVSDPDPEAAAARYAASLPPGLDVVHLGLGADGHTASLVPGDPVLEVVDRDVALTREYRSRRRMTLTFRPLGRGRLVLWLVAGRDKAEVLPRLLHGDPSIPAGRVAARHQVVVADAAAASGLP